MKLPIYMDYHATCPLDPRVLEEMLPYFIDKFGNSASKQHSFGWQAELAVEKARGQLALCVGAKAEELIFTSGATESNNLAVLGFLEPFFGKEAHFITSTIEHSSLRDLCAYLQKKGIRVSLIPVDEKGQVDPENIRKEITAQTRLVSIMTANNEIGSIQPIAEIGKICKEKGIAFHSDAAQALGKIAIDVEAIQVDMLSISAHKNYGPKGVGALYIRSKNPSIRLEAQIHGGGHEKGLRSGTLNVPGIVGLGKACEISKNEMKEESLKLRALRDDLQEKLLKNIEGSRVNGGLEQRLPHNLNLFIPDVRSEVLMMNLKKEIALSSGSACASAQPKPSHVLKAIGLRDEEAACSIRFGLGRSTTAEEVDYVAKRVIEESRKIRG